MFQSMYSLPQQRIVTMDEVRDAYRAAFGNNLRMYDFYRQWLPIEGDEMRPALVHDVINTRFTFPDESPARDSAALYMDLKRDGLWYAPSRVRQQAGSGVPLLDEAVVLAARHVMAIGGKLRAAQGHSFQRAFGAGLRVGEIIGGGPHSDIPFDEAVGLGQLCVMGNAYDVARARAAGLPENVFALEFIDSRDMPYNERSMIEFFNSEKEYAEADALTNKYPRWKFKPNRYYLTADCMLHEAGKPTPAQRAAIPADYLDDVIASLNFGHHFWKPNPVLDFWPFRRHALVPVFR